ncbi:MAG TPA: tetratricopeptide repeat protein [Terriglobales bacterium]|nr:tetratricopeptide repeat protein [Terriglobales bacterium]
MFAILVLAACSRAAGAEQSPKATATDSLQQRYQAARTFTVAGDTDRAAKEYRAFLAVAFEQMANARSRAGSFAEAFQLFEEACALAPDSVPLRVAYSMALLQGGQPATAKVQVEKAVQLAPKDKDAQYLLGRILFESGDYKGAKQHLEAAAASMQGELTFQVGYTLALTYLMLKDANRASLLFDEMLIGFGDSAPLHVYFGHGYLMTGNYDRAITEFKRALEKDPKVREAHYWLGLAYLARDEDKGWDENAAEDRAEIANNPDDFRPHYDLGNIALKLHRTEEAERELKRASEIQPDNPDPLIALGELLISQRRLPEAEAAMSKAIALTKDPSRGAYQINRAYYVLGRIQVETGRREEGVKNLKIATELREKTQAPANRDSGAAAAEERISSAKPMRPEALTSTVSPEQQKQLDAYFEQLKPAIADAYNNLGVAAGAHNDLATAIAYFRKASQWYPALNTLDRNLGMASFHAGNFEDAIQPLWRALGQNPDDQRVRAALGLSYFTLKNYQGTVETLRPIEKTVAGDPGAGVAYAVSLIKTGKYEQGMAILTALEKANPNIAGLHAAMGETYADQGIYAGAIDEYRKSLALDPAQPRIRFLLGVSLLRNGQPSEAVPELRAALKGSPSDVSAKYHLALALLQLEQKEEARALLQQVITEDPRYADGYYQLGKMQLEGGDAKQAIASLESAAALSPRSDYIHYQLSLAYGRDSRPDDAQREMKLYQALKTARQGDHERPRSN